MDFPSIITTQSQGGRAIEKLYEKQEFTDLICQTVPECYRFAQFHCPDIVLPEKYQFLIRHQTGTETFDRQAKTRTVPAHWICTIEQTVDVLLRADGWHLSDIHLGVTAVSEDTTYIEVICGIYGWTNRVLIEHPFFPFPPFIVMGPPLDPDGEEITACQSQIYRLILGPTN